MVNKVLKAKIIEKYGTQADFAQRLGVSEPTISRVVRGRRPLTPGALKKWAQVLKCSSEDLVNAGLRQS